MKKELYFEIPVTGEILVPYTIYSVVSFETPGKYGARHLSL